ncbi:Fic family protein [Psychroflexus salis]|uniref:Filamentation induced by cAMP protein Fic-like C-terminal domain-containing protein n=1 Tax=Psychroflexus salis TaxID=1526574 RepID=A0A916ZMT1_9FLAO|nr:hypothetical protein [Psychroflexus salis]GGE05033.1 hypothetical protein GCM10010831_03340 [Psychroflexus salis]
MRIYRDLDLVEQLGSGLPRILKSYDKSCFYFTENHIRTTLPMEQVTEQVTEQIEKLVSVLNDDMTLSELMTKCEIKHRPTFLYNYIQPALEIGLIQMTIPEKPKSRNQKYKLTALGRKFKNRTE